MRKMTEFETELEMLKIKDRAFEAIQEINEKRGRSVTLFATMILANMLYDMFSVLMITLYMLRDEIRNR